MAAVCAVLDDHQEYLPLTVRQIFYLIVSRYGYPKTEASYARLCEIVNRARRAEMLPFTSIRDDTSVGMDYSWHSGPAGFWDHVGGQLKRYRRDRLQGQDVRIELWCEAAGMLPQLARICNDYSIEAYASGGFASLSHVRQVVDRVIDRDVPTVLLHVGDYDPSGVAVFDHLAEDVAAFVEADRIIATTYVTATRVALLDWQVETYDLATAPPKTSDSRSAKWAGETCQLEALPPRILDQIVRTAIEAELDLDVLQEQIDLERSDVVELRRALPRGTS